MIFDWTQCPGMCTGKSLNSPFNVLFATSFFFLLVNLRGLSHKFDKSTTEQVVPGLLNLRWWTLVQAAETIHSDQTRQCVRLTAQVYTLGVFFVTICHLPKWFSKFPLKTGLYLCHSEVCNSSDGERCMLFAGWYKMSKSCWFFLCVLTACKINMALKVALSTAISLNRHLVTPVVSTAQMAVCERAIAPLSVKQCYYPSWSDALCTELLFSGC